VLSGIFAAREPERAVARGALLPLSFSGQARLRVSAGGIALAGELARCPRLAVEAQLAAARLVLADRVWLFAGVAGVGCMARERALAPTLVTRFADTTEGGGHADASLAVRAPIAGAKADLTRLAQLGLGRALAGEPCFAGAEQLVVAIVGLSLRPVLA
jgi:hypothetical protein